MKDVEEGGSGRSSVKGVQGQRSRESKVGSWMMRDQGQSGSLSGLGSSASIELDKHVPTSEGRVKVKV